jgi:hypothetical protein
MIALARAMSGFSNPARSGPNRTATLPPAAIISRASIIARSGVTTGFVSPRSRAVVA